MHCPYCNAQLIESSNGELECSSSNALFSARVSQLLRARYGHLTSDLPEQEPTATGQWFCPGCGVKMDGRHCAACGQDFDSSLHYQLVELNPHVTAK